MDKIIIYFFIINIIGFFIMWKDKKAAVNHKWRIRENTLFFIAIIGGSLGILAGMRIYRHKTKHKRFVFGIPFIIFLQILILVKLKIFNL